MWLLRVIFVCTISFFELPTTEAVIGNQSKVEIPARVNAGDSIDLKCKLSVNPECPECYGFHWSRREKEPEPEIIYVQYGFPNQDTETWPPVPGVEVERHSTTAGIGPNNFVDTMRLKNVSHETSGTFCCLLFTTFGEPGSLDSIKFSRDCGNLTVVS